MLQGLEINTRHEWPGKVLLGIEISSPGIGPKVTFRRCERQWMIVEMRVPTIEGLMIPLECSRLNRSRHSFVTALSLLGLLQLKKVSLNIMDRNKRVSKEHGKASRQEASFETEIVFYIGFFWLYLAAHV